MASSTCPSLRKDGTMPLELVDFAVLSAITTLTTLLGLYIGLRVAKPRLKRFMEGQRLSITNQVTKTIADVVENIDVGEILGGLGGGGEGGNPLGALAGLLGGGGKGLEGTMSALAALGGGDAKQLKGKGKMGL